jgi:hypothetical protein
MRRASRQRTALVHTTFITPTAQSSLAPVPHVPPHTNGANVNSNFESRQAASEPAATEVRLSPAGTFVSEEIAAAEPDARTDRNRQLAIAIRQRIESRLVGRIRELSVRITGNTVVLEGKCSTYYSKQLAQHAALGALEDEHLENAISVEVPR